MIVSCEQTSLVGYRGETESATTFVYVREWMEGGREGGRKEGGRKEGGRKEGRKEGMDGGTDRRTNGRMDEHSKWSLGSQLNQSAIVCSVLLVLGTYI